jgi:hypothetical protein
VAGGGHRVVSHRFGVAEDGHGLHELLGLLLEAGCRCGTLLHQRGVLLRRLVRSTLSVISALISRAASALR